MIDLFSASRPAGDILSRTVRIVLGGQEFVLPVLHIGGNRRWKATLDESLTALVDGLTASGDDFSLILAALSTQTDALLDLLISYDETHVLPTRESIEEMAYEDELLRAVQEVWRAANPLVVGTLLATLMAEAPPNGISPPTSSSQPPTAGPRKRSRKT